MAKYSIFEILGPVMIGPSSSHTAGAARLAKTVKDLVRGKIKTVNFLLHGSFAKTYRGHGTDKALVAGILGMSPSDERLRKAFEIAKENNLEYDFNEIDLGDAHPNTVKFVIETEDGCTRNITGSSIGGGNIKIINIDGTKVEFTGNKSTIITEHKDIPGVIFKITKAISEANINIGNMSVLQKMKGSRASMCIETDTVLTDEIVEKLKSIETIEDITVINPIE